MYRSAVDGRVEELGEVERVPLDRGATAPCRVYSFVTRASTGQRVVDPRLRSRRAREDGVFRRVDQSLPREHRRHRQHACDDDGKREPVAARAAPRHRRRERSRTRRGRSGRRRARSSPPPRSPAPRARSGRCRSPPRSRAGGTAGPAAARARRRAPIASSRPRTRQAGRQPDDEDDEPERHEVEAVAVVEPVEAPRRCSRRRRRRAARRRWR